MNEALKLQTHKRSISSTLPAASFSQWQRTTSDWN